MKFRSEIIIDREINAVGAVFGDPQNTLQWLAGLRSVEPLTGKMGEVGSTCRVVCESAAGRMKMTETVTVRDLPMEYATVYEGVGYSSRSHHSFETVGESSTRYTLEQEVELHGAFKAAGFLLKGAVRKQLDRTVASFKKFTEEVLET